MLPLRVSGLVVSRADLVAALRVYVPNLADVRPLDGTDDFLLVLPSATGEGRRRAWGLESEKEDKMGGPIFDAADLLQIGPGATTVPKVYVAGGGGRVGWITSDNSFGILVHTSAGEMYLGYSTDGTLATGARVITIGAADPYTGNVGINTATPSEKLEVAGNIKASGKAAIGASVDPGATLALGPVDSGNEGAEILLRGAGSYDDWRADNFQGRLRFIRGAIDVMVLYLNGNLRLRGNRFYAPDIPVDDRYWFAVNGESEANVVLGLWSNAAGTDKRVEIKGDVYVGARKAIDSQGRCLYG